MGIINKRLKDIDIRKINANGSISNEQIVCAKKILCSFDSDLPKCNYVIVKGEPQVGKTGVLYALVNIINKLRLKYVFNVKKVLYITGDNSKDLIKQQKNRSYNDFMTFSVEDDVEIVFLKRSDFKKIMETIDSIDNSIIFIDESHYGTRNKTNQLPYFLKHYGVDYLKNTNLEEHNIRIISCSATPHCEIASDKVECKMTIRLEPGEGYIGQKEFIDNNCAIPLKRNAFDKRCVKKELPNILNYAYNHLKNIEESTGEIKCAIFRISKKSDLDNLKKYGDDYFVIEEFDTTNEKSLNYDSVFNRIDSYCEIPRHRIPNKYLMIVIKDAFRMGISIRERR